MYHSPEIVIGYHGCDLSVAEKVLSGTTGLNASENIHDWLGNGIYFWEGSHDKALEWTEKGAKINEIPRPEIGQRIFTARRSRGISQAELGKKIGATLRAISYYERETDNISASTLKKIAEALGITTTDLLGESPNKIPPADKPFALKKTVEKIEALPTKNRKTVVEMVDFLTAKNDK